MVQHPYGKDPKRGPHLEKYPGAIFSGLDLIGMSLGGPLGHLYTFPYWAQEDFVCDYFSGGFAGPAQVLLFTAPREMYCSRDQKNDAGEPVYGRQQSLGRSSDPLIQILEGFWVRVYSLPIVSIVVPFWGYLLGSLISNWLNQKRNYNGDYR